MKNDENPTTISHVPEDIWIGSQTIIVELCVELYVNPITSSAIATGNIQQYAIINTHLKAVSCVETCVDIDTDTTSVAITDIVFEYVNIQSNYIIYFKVIRYIVISIFY